MTATTNGKPHAKSRSAIPATREPPKNLEAELDVIGSILLDGATVYDDVAAIVRADDFYDGVHQQIFKAIGMLRHTESPIDAVAVCDAVKASVDWSHVDLPALLESAMARIPHAAHAKYHAGIIAKESRRRQGIGIATDLLRDAYDGLNDFEDAVAAAEGKLQAIIEHKVQAQAVPVAEPALGILQRLGVEKKSGLKSGLCDLDSRTRGFQPGQLITLAARPSVGKTALAGNIALSVAESGTGVFFVSLEQSRDELAERFTCTLARVTTDQLNATGERLTEAVRDDITTAVNRLACLPILIDDRTPRTIGEISALARLHRRRDNIGLVVVDYLQLITPEDKRAPREQQVAEISRGLKLLARSLEIPVIALAQLNRSVEARDNKRPRMSDIRDSGAVEQDADIVMFIDRPATYDQKAEESAATLIVAKHRNGQTGDVQLHWDGQTMTFRNAASSRHVEF